MAVDYKRMQFWEQVDEVEINKLTLREVEKRMLDLIAKYGNEARIELQGGHGERKYYAVMQLRSETNAEMAHRIQRLELFKNR
jgi:hypothetical protein